MWTKTIPIDLAAKLDSCHRILNIITTATDDLSVLHKSAHPKPRKPGRLKSRGLAVVVWSMYYVYDVVLTFAQTDCESQRFIVLRAQHVRTLWWCNYYIITSNGGESRWLWTGLRDGSYLWWERVFQRSVSICRPRVERLRSDGETGLRHLCHSIQSLQEGWQLYSSWSQCSYYYQ